MLNFFGISKKEKISVKDTSNIFSVALNKVVGDGFPEIQSFLNNNNNLEKSPRISDEDIKWFRLIIFAGNLHIISTKFDESETLALRNHIVDDLLPHLDKDKEVSMDIFLQYETYYNDNTQSCPDAGAASYECGVSSLERIASCENDRDIGEQDCGSGCDIPSPCYDDYQLCTEACHQAELGE